MGASNWTIILLSLVAIIWGIVFGISLVKAFLVYFRSRYHSLQYFSSSAQFNFFEWDFATDQVTLFGHDPKVKAFYKKETTNYEQILQLIHADDRSNFKLVIDRLKNRSKNFDSIEYRVRLPDSIRWVSMHGQIREKNDHVILNGYIQDVTDFKKDFLEQKIITEQYQSLLEEGNIGFWHWDLATSQLTVNSSFARLFNHHYDGSRFPSDFLTERIYEADRQMVHRHFLSIINGETKASEWCFRIRRQDDSYRWVSCKAAANHRDELGHTVSLVGILIDIDDQKKVQMALTKSEEESRQLAKMLEKKMIEAEVATKLKGAFLANMSHEIRTPLNAIIGMTEVIKDGPLNESQRYYMDIVTHAGDNLLVLINDILDSSKIEAGEVVITKKLFDIRTMVARAIDLISFRFRNKNIVFSYVVGDEVEHQIEGDEFRIYQVLINLLGNAGKFTDQGEVTLSVHAQEHPFGKELVLNVTDTGRGIPSSELSSIFNAFSQVNVDQKKLVEGTGLGLSISKKILSLMGGKVSVQSQVEVGSTFVASLPYVNSCWVEDHREKEILPFNKIAIVNPNPRENEFIDLQLRRDRISAQFYTSLSELNLDLFDFALIDWQILNEIESVNLFKKKNEDLLHKIVVLMSADFQQPLSYLEYLGLSPLILYRPFSRIKIKDCVKDHLCIFDKNHDSTMMAKPEILIKPEYVLPSVLLVDDSDSNLELLRLILKDHVSVIDTAKNGVEAIERFSRRAYELILMDIQMPELDGHQAFKLIREMEKQRQLVATPIWAVTAYVHDEAIEEIKNTGFDLYFNKPIKRKAFLQVLENNFNRTKKNNGST